jgi:hypothetical protein
VPAPPSCGTARFWTREPAIRRAGKTISSRCAPMSVLMGKEIKHRPRISNPLALRVYRWPMCMWDPARKSLKAKSGGLWGASVNSVTVQALFRGHRAAAGPKTDVHFR